MERWRPWFLSLPACLPASLSKNNKEQRGINERSLNAGHYFGSAHGGGWGARACAHLSAQHGVPERRPPKPGPSSPLPQHLVISMSRSTQGHSHIPFFLLAFSEQRIRENEHSFQWNVNLPSYSGYDGWATTRRHGQLYWEEIKKGIDEFCLKACSPPPHPAYSLLLQTHTFTQTPNCFWFV